MENNKLIAEFMGVVFHDDENQYYSSDGIYMVIHQYHTSWDWLMPVIDKCYQEHMSKQRNEYCLYYTKNKRVRTTY